MAKKVLLNAYVEWNGVNLSAFVRRINNFPINIEEVEATTMGTNGVREILAGLQSYDMSVTFANDFAAGGPNDTIFADAIAGTARAIEVRQDGAARSATNPGFQTTLRCTQLPLVAGGVGELDEVTYQFRSTGTAMTRAVA